MSGGSFADSDSVTASEISPHLDCAISITHPLTVRGDLGTAGGQNLQPEQVVPFMPGYRALSVGARRFPVIFSLMAPVRGGIGSQIALKMSLDASIEETTRALLLDKQGDAMELLRLAFRESNKRVYEYAHRMGQGGNIAATGLIAVYDGQKLAVGCVGAYTAYLVRSDTTRTIRVLNFFQEQAGGGIQPTAKVGEQVRVDAGVLQRFIGANAKILVDLASTEVKEGDVIVILSLSPEPWLGELVGAVCREQLSVAEADLGGRLCWRAGDVETIARCLARDVANYRQARMSPLESGKASDDARPIACLAMQVGPQVITLF